MAKKSRSHERADGQAQISVSLPQSLLEKIDAHAKRDRRGRSDWIVNEIEKRIAFIEAQEALEREGKAARRISPFPSTAEASAPRGGVHLNEEPARPSAVPAPSEPVQKPLTRSSATAKKAKPPKK